MIDYHVTDRVVRAARDHLYRSHSSICKNSSTISVLLIFVYILWCAGIHHFVLLNLLNGSCPAVLNLSSCPNPSAYTSNATIALSAADWFRFPYSFIHPQLRLSVWMGAMMVLFPPIAGQRALTRASIFRPSTQNLLVWQSFTRYTSLRTILYS